MRRLRGILIVVVVVSVMLASITTINEFYPGYGNSIIDTIGTEIQTAYSAIVDGIAGIFDNATKSTTATAEDTAEVDKLIEDILKGATHDDKHKGKTDQWFKDGGMKQAEEDFEKLNPSNVKDTGTVKYGTLLDGRNANVRDKSTYGQPTLEIQNSKNKGRIKIRYNP